MRSIRSKKNSNIKRIISEWYIPILAALIVAILIHKFVLFKVLVPTGSMEPAIMPGDQILVTRIYNPDKIKRGEIVVFNSKELHDRLIKRVVGLPGDKVTINDKGQVFINNNLLSEPYIKYPSDKTGNFVVPKDKFLMLGDNRADSFDARYWNNPYISGQDITAKAVLRVYPFNRISLLN